ncbi:MAG: OmpA family protein [Saprospiraceae bacterium]
MLKKVVLSCLLAIVTVAAFAQKEKPKTAGWYEKTGNMYYENKKYLKALPYLLKYQTFKATDNDAKFKIGKCYLETGRAEKAQEYFDFLLSQKNINGEVYHLMAQTMHLSHDFDNAILYYKQYLGTLDDNDPQRYFIKDNIKRCAVGRKIIYKDQLGLVENLGDKINTAYDDFAPVFAPNYDNIIYFSSVRDGNFGGMFDEEGKEDTLKGDYRSDIYVSRLSKGEWTMTTALDERYNTVYHDVINGFSKDGGLVYLSQSKDMYYDYGDIYMNNFFEEEGATTESFKLPEPINSYDWDGDVFFFNNNTMLMSSDRKSGYGGKDIYISKKGVDGKWTIPTNLGPGVNTPYDEVSPFLAADGKTLYFSSNNLESIGGYDVFIVKFDEQINNWTKATNLGMPINSAADDAYFKVSEDGLRAFFSSSRPDGFGMRDLYVTYFRRIRPEQQNTVDTISFQYAIDAGLLSNKVVASQVTETPVDEGNKTIESERYKFAPLYYAESGESETLEMNSLLELNKLIKLLKKHQNLNVELASYIDNDGTAVHFNLFFSLKNAENVADYMTDQGISPNRIYLKGLGANYPVSKSRQADGTAILGGKRLNKRVEIKVYRPETASLIIEYTQPAIVDAMAVKTNIIHQKITKGISYKVQVKTLNTMLDDKVLSEYSDPLIERVADNANMKYTVGLVKSHRTAEELRQELIAKGFTDAFIVVYKDGERLETKEDIQKFVSLFPDLKNMLK